jgi:rhodanese-related sulfurtransferase
VASRDGLNEPGSHPLVKPIQLEEVRRLLDQGVQLVEVLPREEYEEEHLPGAINIPLKELDADTTAQLVPDRAVVVYCWDSL